MQTKLTLRLDSDAIAAAKRFARARGKSLSAMVADFFASLEPRQDVRSVAEPRHGPHTEALTGLLAGQRAEESDYYAHLEEKHR